MSSAVSSLRMYGACCMGYLSCAVDEGRFVVVALCLALRSWFYAGMYGRMAWCWWLYDGVRYRYGVWRYAWGVCSAWCWAAVRRVM